MNLNAAQQQALRKSVDIMMKEGFFLPDRRELTGDTRYLIVGVGGTGIEALFEVKKRFETELPQEQLASRVRFLGVDTDFGAMKKTASIRRPNGIEDIVVEDTLNSSQFIGLDGTVVRLHLRDDSVTQWINPQLRQRVENDYAMLCGSGASGIRQLGRLALYANSTLVMKRIRQLAGELMFGNIAQLRVFILSGISGGTGSGMVTDLTYLIRNVMEDMGLDSSWIGAPARTRYAGFLLLPPTGSSTDPIYVSHGNANGYAAMKEINHFMTIAQRGGEYRMTCADGREVVACKNVFDSCFLLDSTIGGIMFEKPREHAMTGLSESILDMVTSYVDMGTRFPLAEFFLQDNLCGGAGYGPQSADSVFSVLEHSEFAIPIPEIRAYVAKQMFDKIHKLFRNFDNVAVEDVKDFLKNVLKKGVKTKVAAVHTMDEEIETWFINPRGGKGGPYFAVNLLKDVVDEVSRQRNKNRLTRISLASDTELDHIEQYAQYLLHSTFCVHAAAMDILKDVLDKQYSRVVKSGREYIFYTFIPQSMGSIQNVGSVIGYLDGLINRENLYQLTEAMLREMLDKKNEWTALARDDSSDGINAMRRFWDAQMDKLLRANMEDLLVKYYSGNPDAAVDPQAPAQAIPYLQQAAHAIYHQMLGRGGRDWPMANFGYRNLQDLHSFSYLTVPECAPNLYQEMKTLAACDPQVVVCTGKAADRISCRIRYERIPARALAWIGRAERDYEQMLRFPGGRVMHMSETEEGFRWDTAPNL